MGSKGPKGYISVLRRYSKDIVKPKSIALLSPCNDGLPDVLCDSLTHSMNALTEIKTYKCDLDFFYWNGMFENVLRRGERLFYICFSIVLCCGIACFVLVACGEGGKYGS